MFLTMRPIDVMNNISNYGMFPQNYPLSEVEAETCVHVLKKRVPVVVKSRGDSRICPIENCAGIIRDPITGYKANFCPECGQAIKWED